LPFRAHNPADDAADAGFVKGPVDKTKLEDLPRLALRLFFALHDFKLPPSNFTSDFSLQTSDFRLQTSDFTLQSS
jgi:hypothetical protein